MYAYRERMQAKLPRQLIVGLALFSLISYLWDRKLETDHLDYLQAHPITVNLLSGMTGFSVSILVVAVGFEWYARKSRYLGIEAELKARIRTVESGVNSIFTEIEVRGASPTGSFRLGSEERGSKLLAPIAAAMQLRGTQNWLKRESRRRAKLAHQKLSQLADASLPNLIKLLDTDGSQLDQAMAEFRYLVRQYDGVISRPDSNREDLSQAARKALGGLVGVVRIIERDTFARHVFDTTTRPVPRLSFWRGVLVTSDVIVFMLAPIWVLAAQALGYRPMPSSWAYAVAALVVGAVGVVRIGKKAYDALRSIDFRASVAMWHVFVLIAAANLLLTGLRDLGWVPAGATIGSVVASVLST
jgi:hypothetical protein